MTHTLGSKQSSLSVLDTIAPGVSSGMTYNCMAYNCIGLRLHAYNYMLTTTCLQLHAYNYMLTTACLTTACLTTTWLTTGLSLLASVRGTRSTRTADTLMPRRLLDNNLTISSLCRSANPLRGTICNSTE